MNFNDSQDIKNYASFLHRLTGKELALIATITGFAIAQNLNSEEMNSIGNFLELIGQVLLSIGSQEQLIEPNNGYNSK